MDVLLNEQLEKINLVNDSNILVIGDFSQEVLYKIMEKGSFNWYFNDQNKRRTREMIEDMFSLSDNKQNLKKMLDGNLRDKKTITYRSFSMVVDFSAFSYASYQFLQLTDITPYMDYRYESSSVLFNEEAYAEEAFDESMKATRNIKANLASGFLTVDDLNKQQQKMLETDEKEFLIKSNLESIKEFRAHNSSIRSKRMDKLFTREDNTSIPSLSSVLKDNGLYLYFTVDRLVDNQIGYQFTREMKNVKFLGFDRNDSHSFDSLDFRSKVKPILIIGEREKRNFGSNNVEGAALSTLFQYPFVDKNIETILSSRIQRLHEVYETENTFANEFANVSRLHALMIKSIDDILSYSTPATKEDDVELFRIGNMSFSELLKESSTSRLVENRKKLEEAQENKFSSFAPTALHDGHIAMLLTSGLLNSYIGKGKNQHLTKGRSFKELISISDNVSRESYGIKLTTLNANGEFRSIM